MNNIKVFVLMAGLTALLVALGGALGGENGLVFALVFAIAANFFMYFQSDKLVLRAYRARVVSKEEAPELYAIVDGLRQRAGIPMPTLAIAPRLKRPSRSSDPMSARIGVTPATASRPSSIAGS